VNQTHCVPNWIKNYITVDFIYLFICAFEVTEVWDFDTGHEVHVQLGHKK